MLAQYINAKRFETISFPPLKGFNDVPWNNPGINAPNLSNLAERGIRLARLKGQKKRNIFENVNVFFIFPELVLLRVLLRAQPRRPPHGTLPWAQEGAEQNGKKFLSRLLWLQSNRLPTLAISPQAWR